MTYQRMVAIKRRLEFGYSATAVAREFAVPLEIVADALKEVRKLKAPKPSAAEIKARKERKRAYHRRYMRVRRMKKEGFTPEQIESVLRMLK